MTYTLRNTLVPAVGALLAINSFALAAPDIYNPSFEEANPAFPTRPQGWNPINADTLGYVDINDPGAHVRTGTRSIRILPSTNEGNRFRGWTTNVFLPDGSDLYDPDYAYLGGDVTISGYYLVPDGEVIQDTIVGVKLELRREPPNFSVYAAFEFPFPSPTTNGQWMPFEFVLTDAMVEAVGDFPPYATSMSILPFRFFGGTFGPGTSPTGTVYIDDLSYSQGTAVDCPADFAEPMGVLNFFDIQAFIAAYNAQNPAADLAAPVGVFNFFDIQAYIALYNQGCP